MSFDSVLLDQGWFRDYDDKKNWQGLLRLLEQLGDASIDIRIRKIKQNHIFNATSKESPGISGFYLLERAFDFENLYIDKEALRLRGSEIPEQLHSFITPISPTAEVYKSATEIMLAEISEAPDSVKARFSDLSLWPKTEYFDRLWSSQDVPASIAQSNPGNDWCRAYFYLAFAEALQVTPLLSGSKAQYVSELGLRTFDKQEKIVKEIFDAAFLKEWRSVSEIGGDSYALWSQTAPPILEHITSKAISSNTSAFTLLQDLRQSAPAKEYRLLMAALREAFSGGRAGHMEALRILKGLKKVAETWSTTLDFDTHITHVPRTLELSCLPLVGRLLKFSGMDKKEIKDKILSDPPGFLVFCSSWYSNKFEYEFGNSIKVT